MTFQIQHYKIYNIVDSLSKQWKLAFLMAQEVETMSSSYLKQLGAIIFNYIFRSLLIPVSGNHGF